MTDLSRAAVHDAVTYFDSWLAFRQRYSRIPGVQAAVLHGDEVLLSEAYGHADVEAGVELTPRHLFRIASHSKTFTATAVLQLSARGDLRLDDPIGGWLPFLDGAPLGSVTVRELLGHSAGAVRDGHDGDFWQLYREFPDEAGLQKIALDDADIIPSNERFKYSNIGYSLLGLVVAAASGQSYNSYVREHIVDRLSLADTGPEYDAARASEYACGYTALAYSDRRVPVDHVDTAAMSPATGFYSTAEDVVRYVAAHFHGDDRILSDASKRLMQRAEWKVDGSEGEYGLGLDRADIGGRRVFGHGGGYPGHITKTYFDPEDRLAVSVLTNAIDGPAEPLASGLVRLVNLATESAGEAGSRDDAELTRFTGRFATMW
ncbi:serine hydrolase domain-containing protein, partial [Phytoactinopolyspora endophytica]|uniref:serine hydrolase domain-containing protein n=1 Tax=Phytoactinopolyspora endophytica TaxID=1642495 RepID=UPI0013ED444B